MAMEVRGAVVAVDPGTRNTGMVLLTLTGSAPVVAGAATARWSRGVGTDQMALARRAEECCREVAAFVEKAKASARGPVPVVMEGFTPLRGKPRPMSYQTSWLCGALAMALASVTGDLSIQTSAQVLNPKRRGSMAWAAEAVKAGGAVVRGQGRVTNEHERSALAHALYWAAARGWPVPSPDDVQPREKEGRQ